MAGKNPEIVVTNHTSTETGGAVEDEVIVVSKRVPSSHSLNSHASSVSQASVNKHLSILGWLRFVDRNLDKHTACELLCLGSKSENIGEGVVENCRRPSEFYQHLRTLFATESQALARFVYGLQGLGKDGKYCNEQFLNKCKFEPPSTEEYEEKAYKNEEFAFYQMLVQMCMHLQKDRALFKRFHKYICHNILISKSYNDETPSGLILRMLYYPDILSVKKHDQLALALDTVGDEAGLLILEHYRSKFSMGEIELESLEPRRVEDNITRLPPSSTATASIISSESNYQSGVRPVSPRNLLDHPEETLKDRLGRYISSTQISKECESEFIEPGQQSLLSTRHTTTEDTPLIRGDLGKQKSCFSVKFLVSAIIVVLVAVLICGAGATMMMLASIETSSISSRTTVHNNTNVALGTVQKFTTSRVSIYQDPDNSEVHMPLKFYHSGDGKSCNSLSTSVVNANPDNNQSLALKQTQIVLLRDYLMPGSVLNYTFCAVTNHSRDTKYSIDLYLANSLSESTFDPKTSDYSYDRNIPIVYDENLQQNDQCLYPVEYNVKQRGPYSIDLLLPSEVPLSDVRLWYWQNNSLKVIDTLRLTKICVGSSANRTYPCTITIGPLKHYISVFCVVVQVGDSSYGNFTTIHVTLKESDTGKIWFYVVGVFVATTAALLFICTILLLFRYGRN